MFAALAFALSMLGLFSVVSLDVTHRRREVALRRALGATGGHSMGGVLRSAGARAAIGESAGLVVAVVVTRSLESLLFGVSLADAVTCGLVVAMVAIVVAISAYLPARRAAASEPSTLLR